MHCTTSHALGILAVFSPNPLAKNFIQLILETRVGRLLTLFGHAYGSSICPTNARRGTLGFLWISPLGEHPKCSTKGVLSSFLAHFFNPPTVAGMYIGGSLKPLKFAILDFTYPHHPQFGFVPGGTAKLGFGICLISPCFSIASTIPFNLFDKSKPAFGVRTRRQAGSFFPDMMFALGSFILVMQNSSRQA